MILQVKFRQTLHSLVLVLAWGTARAWAGGSGLNVAVVVNQNDTSSVQLGNYYCEQRQVPPQNLLRVNWPGGNIEWTNTDLEVTLFTPLKNALADRGLSNQVDYVVLSMGFPYRVAKNGNQFTRGKNSTTSVLFYGFKPDYDTPSYIPASCNMPDATASPYAGSELPFRSVTNGSAWLACMITALDLPAAKAIVDRGVASDGTFPTQQVFLTKSTDDARNVRYLLFDNAILDTRVLGCPQLVPTNTYTPVDQGYQLGSQNGSYNFGLGQNLFAPGAMADNLTSYSGVLFENSGMTGVMDFLAAGATASYGTVVEPCNYLEKFPSPQNYLYQARGFSIAECYFQSVTNPYQGILVGEPLAAPFASKPNGAWTSLPSGALLSGTTNLSLQITAFDASRPVQQVDLFLDGKWLRTLTNIAPRQGNVLTATIYGQPIRYTVPAGATLNSVAGGLADEINQTANTNATRVRAFAHGDRIELQSFELGRPGDQVAVATASAIGNASALTTFLSEARANLLDTTAYGWRNFVVTNAVQPGNTLQLVVTKTNGFTVALSATNPPGNTNTSILVKLIVDAVNTNADLTQPDGLTADDFIAYDIYNGTQGGEFNLRSRNPGWLEAQLDAALTGSLDLVITPGGTNVLDEKPGDLMPRNHLYLTAGVTNLPLTFAFNTTTLADGSHELTAVAYEGSHVRTQKRIAQDVRIANTPLSAAFTTLVGGSNTLVTTTLQFAVTPNTNTLSRIELFSTGGWLAGVTNQSSATFSVPGTNLDLGLHPFCALVTRNDGKQYRTATTWIRLVGPDSAEPPFTLTAAAPPPVLSWPATVGRTYQVLSATNSAAAFQPRATFVATNSPIVWAETNLVNTARFYRVQALP